MMRRALSALLLLCGLASQGGDTQAANTSLLLSLGESCPYGTAFADGCPGAPVRGSFQRPTFFYSYARQSGQATYVTRPPWNVAGVDYAIGIAATSYPLKDPFGGVPCTNGNRCNMPVGCVLTAGQYFLCSGTSNITIDAYDFTLNNGLGVRNNLNSGATLTVTNSNFKRLSNNASIGNLISSVLGTTNNLVVQNNVFDGNCNAFPTSSFTSLVSHSGATGTFLSEYNAYLNSPASITQTSSASNRTEQFNYGEGMICVNAGLHTSWSSTQTPSGTIPTWTFNFNTAMSIAVPFGQTGITAFAEVGCNGCTGMTTANVRNNVFIANRTTGTVGATMGYVHTIQTVTVGTANIIENYVDPTGMLGNQCFALVAGPTIGTSNVSGNLNMLDGSAASFSPPCNGHF